MNIEWAECVREVARKLLEWRPQGGCAGSWQGTQYKAEADCRAHDLLSRLLNLREPVLPVVSEEDPISQNLSARPAHYWLIDPLDGTASYAAGFDGFVCQAALMDKLGPAESVVIAPALGLEYQARRGEGAWKNNSRIFVKPCLEPTLIDNYPAPRGITSTLFKALHFTQYVESGSIGLKICRVADATADLFIKDVIVRDWDLAAPHLVLTEAGGHITTACGSALQYNGHYEKSGLIASSSESLWLSTKQWYANHYCGSNI